ncbi:2-hydroxyacid dehydrogenase [Desulfamplus magnetovallimortis]|nr:NAD(P)-dependent oxidoreductase [Desulfamplus magnetovallimortis]
MKKKCTVYLTSPVFREMAENELVSISKKERITELFKLLEESSNLIESDVRFPSGDTMKEIAENNRVDIIGCHLSHTISGDITNLPHLKAVCTATAGYNHIERTSGLIVTHTPSVLHDAVSDFILSLILSTLKNIPALNSFVFQGKWREDQKWDIDAFLGRSLSTLAVGIIGMGEIGQTLAHKLAPWNMKILYNSRIRKNDLEKKLPCLCYCKEQGEIFRNADIISLNVPLTDKTLHLAGKDQLLMMKRGALLINTARGEVVDMDALLQLLESGDIEINLAFDVFDPEPLPVSMLDRFKNIVEKKPDLKFIFMPHTASADADTRAEMVIMMLSDILTIAEAVNVSNCNIGYLNDKINLIPC